MMSAHKPHFSLQRKAWFITPWLMLIPYVLLYYTSYDFASLVPYAMYKPQWAVNLTLYNKIYNSSSNEPSIPLNKTQDKYTSTEMPKSSKADFNCSQVWVSSYADGRLGNNMCEYAHLLVLKLEYGVQVGLTDSLYNALSGAFPHLSVKIVPPECHKGKRVSQLHWGQVKKRVIQNKLTNPVIVIGYPCVARDLWPHRDTWRREFAFKQTYLDKASNVTKHIVNKWRDQRQSKLAKISKSPKIAGPNSNVSQTPVVVGVHVRRTDYEAHLKKTVGGTFLKANYFKAAFEFFRRKYKDVLFIVTSDDRAWCRQLQAEDVFIAPEGSAEEDLALLSMSSHLIMSVGTYGFWAGALSHGAVIFPQKVGERREYFMTKFLKEIHSDEVIAFPNL